MSSIQPIERFPVKPRSDGRFQKRIHGRLYYFGQDGNRDQALREYDRVKRDLYDGRTPRALIEPATLRIKELANVFTDEQEARAKSGEISEQHFKDYRRAIRRYLKFIGSGRLVEDLAPDDFSDYGRYLLKQLSGHAFNRERSLVRAMFRHAYECGWIVTPIRFGRGFQKYSKAELRRDKRDRLLDDMAIRKLLRVKDRTMRAVILLGLNGGFGPEDLSKLRWPDVDLKLGRIDTTREKRHTVRQVPLWPETVTALQRLPRTGDFVFDCTANVIKKQYADLPIDRPKGVALGALRHTFVTIADEAGDRNARETIVGHVLPGLDDVYIERVTWERLERVTDHVRSKVFST